MVDGCVSPKQGREMHWRMPYLMLFLASETTAILFKSLLISTLSFSTLCLLV